MNPQSAMGAQGNVDCPWFDVCDPVDPANDLWIVRPMARGYVGPAGPHRHDHTRCVPTGRGMMGHPDDVGPHDACGPAEHPTGLPPWPAAVYAVLVQRSTVDRVLPTWHRIVDMDMTPAEWMNLSSEVIANMIRPVGLQTVKADTLRRVAAAFALAFRQNIDPANVLPRIDGWGDTTHGRWLATMHP